MFEEFLSEDHFLLSFTVVLCQEKPCGGVFFDYMAPHIECRFQQKLPPPVLLFRDFASAES